MFLKIIQKHWKLQSIYIIDKFDAKKCDITETIEHLDISQVYRSVDIKKIDYPEKISEDLVRHIKLFKLKTLNLSHGSVTSEAVQELSYFLKDNITLSQLDLSFNDIQAEGDILRSLETSTCTALKMLNLSCNNKITGGKKCREIAHKILSLDKTHKITVDITNNKFSEESNSIYID